MSQNTTIHAENINLLYHEDGLIDIFIGLVALTFGLEMLTDAVYMAGILPAILVPVWIAARKAITLPRMGDANPVSAQTIASRRLMLMLFFGFTAFAGVAVFFFFNAEGLPAQASALLDEYFMVGFGIGGAVVLGVVGSVLNAPRLYGYAALSVVLFTVGYQLQTPLPWATVLLGALILISGLLVLVRFIQNHPRE